MLVSFDGVVRDPDLPLLHADDLGAVRGRGCSRRCCWGARVPKRSDCIWIGFADGARLLGRLPSIGRPRPGPGHRHRRMGPLRGEDEAMVRLAYSRGAGSRLQAMARPICDRRGGPERIVATRISGWGDDARSWLHPPTSGGRAPWQLLGAKS